MTLGIFALTGGLHRDGLMDACDALFSRRDRETRLRILSDPHCGAFAVMGCVVVFLVQGGVFTDLLERVPRGYRWGWVLSLAVVPVWSRLGLGLLLNTLPFAKDDGLARTLGAARTPYHTPILLLGAASLAVLSAGLGGVRALAVPTVWLMVLLLWRRCCMTIFGGITGDLLGAFAELSETVMLLTLAVMR